MSRSRILIILILFNLFLASSVQLYADVKSDQNGFMVHPITVTRKVLRDEPLPECFGNLSVKPYKKILKVPPREAELKKMVKVCLARNEYESAQIVIKSITQDLHNVKVKINLAHYKKNMSFPKKTYHSCGLVMLIPTIYGTRSKV